MMHKTEGYTHAQAEMLKYVFNHGKVSRAELAQALNVSNLTVINGVKSCWRMAFWPNAARFPANGAGKSLCYP